MENFSTITISKGAGAYVYELTLGNYLSGKASDEHKLKQGNSFKCDDEELKVSYYVVFLGFKMIRRIYQPSEIVAELDVTQSITDTSGTKKTTTPSFDDVNETLLRRLVTLKFVPVDETSNERTFTIAENFYVHEVEPQLQRDTNGTKMIVKLHIFSIDKLMTLNKYSKAYVARKLGSGILKPESLIFGKWATDGKAMVNTDITGLRFLKYDEQILVPDVNGGQTTMNINSEFIQPYLVQYNESFYDFMVRTANRCGEFLFFENGKLMLGLPDIGNHVEIDEFQSVTQHSYSPAPLDITPYSRDSVKDGNGQLKDLNQTVINKLSTGYPADAFPANTTSNAELANDEFIFPLYRGKFTKLKRENFYDSDASKALTFFKSLTTGTEPVSSVVVYGVSQALLAISGNSQIGTTNGMKEEHHMKPYENKEEQANEEKVVQFSSLNEEGWTTINYYNDIHKHEVEQQSKIICIDLGASFADVKLGQKISIKDMAGTYVIIRIQQDEMSHSLKIEAIPALYDEGNNNKEKIFPPVEPVPVIRKSGPQTAFIVDNDDPKYQGRVRVAYPWQSLKGAKKAELFAAEEKLAEAQKEKISLEAQKGQLYPSKISLMTEIDNLQKYCNASEEKRKEMLEEKKQEKESLEADIKTLEAEKKKCEDQKDISEKSIKQKESELATLKKDPKSSKAEIKQKKVEIETEHNAVFASKENIDSFQRKIDNKKRQVERCEREMAEMKAVPKNNAIITKKQEACKEADEKINTIDKKLQTQNQIIENCQSAANKAKEEMDKDIVSMASPWIRVATPMATPGGGTYFRPQKGDEVLINYDNDNIERPYVVGSLFSKNTIEPADGYERNAAPSIQFGVERQVSMAIMSPNGHHITFSDPAKGDKFLYNLNPGTKFWGPTLGKSAAILPNSKDLAGGIHIGDRYGVYEIEMSTQDRCISIKSPFGNVNVSAFTGINIEAPNGDINIKGKNINIQAGNNLTLTSGNNIEPEGIGEPDVKCGSWLYKLGKSKAAKIPLGFLTGFQAIAAGFLWLGHQILTYGPAAANEELGGAAFADLSLFRHMFEVFVKPVEGTMLIKSKRYLKLEAGPGVAKIKAENFPNKDKINTQEKFYVELIEVLNDLMERVNKFHNSYEEMWTAAVNASFHYQEVADGFLKDPKDPDIRKEAFTLQIDEWDDEAFIGGGFPEKMKDEDVSFKGARYTGKEKNDFFCIEIVDYAKKVYALHHHVLGLTDLLKDYEDDNTFKKAAKEAFKDYAEEALAKWKDKYGDNNPNEEFAQWGEDLFTKKKALRLFKRKLAAMYLVKVAESDLNKENKFLSLGYGESDIVDSKVQTTFNWKNMMTRFDHKGTFGNKFMIYLMDGIWEPIKSKFQNPVKSYKENKIWADQSGQILFSENDGSTLHFNGAKLESESQSNLGNREQLIKVLLSL